MTKNAGNKQTTALRLTWKFHEPTCKHASSPRKRTCRQLETGCLPHPDRRHCLQRGFCSARAPAARPSSGWRLVRVSPGCSVFPAKNPDHGRAKAPPEPLTCCPWTDHPPPPPPSAPEVTTQTPILKATERDKLEKGSRRPRPTPMSRAKHTSC